MKPKKLKKRIQQLEKRLQEDTQKLGRLRRKLQESETARALKAARKSAARATASAETKKPSAKKAKRKYQTANVASEAKPPRIAIPAGLTVSNRVPLEYTLMQ